MISAAPDLGVPRGLERGLLWTIGLSALVHCGLFALAIALPGRGLTTPPRIESYTVDLVAPDVVGGTNLVSGGRRSAEPAPPPNPAPAAPPAPPQHEAAQVAPEVPEPRVADRVAAPAAPPPVPPAPAAKAVAPPKPAEPPKPAAPKAEPKPQENAALKVEPKPPSKPAPPKAEAKEVAKEPAKVPAVATKADAKVPAVSDKTAKAAPAAKVAKASDQPQPSPPAAAEKKPTSSTTTAAKPTPVADSRDRAIADAIQRRAQQVKDGTASGAKVDQQIAAAVNRRAAQVDKLSGAPGTASGGAISSGAGAGAGGTPTDLQYILYHGRMIERIKAAWAWAGADKSLRVVVQFNISPDGQISNVRVIESSGDAQYDTSAERAVRAVNPLEPIPEQYRAAFATQEITFQASDLES